MLVASLVPDVKFAGICLAQLVDCFGQSRVDWAGLSERDQVFAVDAAFTELKDFRDWSPSD